MIGRWYTNETRWMGRDNLMMLLWTFCYLIPSAMNYAHFFPLLFREHSYAVLPVIYVKGATIDRRLVTAPAGFRDA
jgi:hypothetical protein